MSKLIIQGMHGDRYELQKSKADGYVCVHFNHPDHVYFGNVFLVVRLTKRGLSLKGSMFGQLVAVTVSSKLFDFREVQKFLEK